MQNTLLKKILHVWPVIFIAGLTLLIVSYDTFEWFYGHSRRYEVYQYDEIILCLFLFLIIGLLWLAFHLYKNATARIDGSIESGGPVLPRVHIGLRKYIRRMSSPLPDSYKASLLLLLSLLAVIVAAEKVLDMIFMPLLPEYPAVAEALIDSAVLVLVISPALYIIFLRPLLDQILMRERIEESLAQLNQQLEERIEKRTAQLHTELEERKRAEAKLVEHRKQLRSLSLQLTLVEERERHRIAAELHDNIGHALAMVNNQLERLNASLPAGQEKKVLKGTLELVINAIRYSRSLGSELSSPLINYLPLVSVVDLLAEDILERNGVAFTLQAEGSPELPSSDTRIIFIKAIREIMINIVKHAIASNVEITVGNDDDSITVAIKDDGIGFDVDAIAPVSTDDWRGFGIFTIRERMEGLKGRFLIMSEPGRGTRAVLSIPYAKEETERNS